MKLSKKIIAINAIVFEANKFTFYEHDFGEWFPVYVDLDKYRKSKIIYATYFSHIYCELLYDFTKALNLSYLFTFSSVEYGSGNDIFLGDKTNKIKTKNSNIRLSAYLQHLVKTFEDNECDIFCPKSVHALFEYDDVDTVEIVRSILISFIVRGSSTGISKGLEIFKKNTKEALETQKEIEGKKLVKKQASILESYGDSKNTLPKWFPIGLGFATGEIQKKIKSISAREIVKEYKLAGYQNYITCTGTESPKDPKNIYSDIKKLELVYNHCVKNDIKICDDFTKAYNIKLEK